MREVNCHVQCPLDAASLPASPNEQESVMSSDDIGQPVCGQERLSVEIAVEWAHLGGD